MSTDYENLPEYAAMRRSLWTVIDALGLRGQVQPTDDLVDLVRTVENATISLTEALVLGVFLTNAAEQQMTLAVEARITEDRGA